MTANLDRFFAIETALRAGRPRPDPTGARFAAAALLAGEADGPALAESARDAHKDLSAGLKGNWFHTPEPTGSQRWAFAAVLAVNGVPADRFLGAREMLRAAAKDERGPGLYAGGTRAALVFSLRGELSSFTVRRFFELKRALTAPWWRRDDAVTDTFAAAHAANGDTPQTVTRARQGALDILAGDRRAKRHKREGARLCVLLEQDAREVLARFQELEAARRALSWLKPRSSATLSMEWAAQGLSRDDLAAIEAVMRALPRGSASAGYARARLAHLIHTGGGRDLPLGSINALSAVMAAQAAALAAVIAGTTAATTAATTAGS